MANAQSLAQRVVRMVMDRARGTRVPLTKAQAEAAVWLRGNRVAHASLKELITARMEARRQSPVSTEPNAALVEKARDNECVHILRELELIVNSPMPSLNEGDQEEQ